MLNFLKSLIFFVWISSSIGLSKAVLLNGPAASVGKDLITVQDAYIYRALQRYKEAQYPVVKLESGEILKRTIQKAAFEHMVFLELKSFEFETAHRSIVEKEVIRIKNKGKATEWTKLLGKFQLSEKDASELLYRNLQVERFMQKKVETLTPIITDQEIEKYYRDNPSRFKGSSFDQMKPNIQVLLKKQQIQKGLEEWIQFLKEKYGFAILLEG